MAMVGWGVTSVKKHNSVHFIMIIVYFFLGLIIGIVIDKDWLSNEQMQYVWQLRSENNRLVEEKQAWVQSIKSELNAVTIFTTADQEQFQNLKESLAAIGITLEKLPETIGLNQQQGIIISLGEELEETYGLPQLNLKGVPTQEVELYSLYLSLLRMKEELLR